MISSENEIKSFLCSDNEHALSTKASESIYVVRQKIWWGCRARDLFESQVPVTTETFELQNSSDDVVTLPSKL